MIAIINDAGDSLQLDPDQDLVTEQNVAWLSDDELPSEYSYPIDAPLNDNNKRFVQQGYRPDGARPRSQMPVRVELNGVLYRRCTYSFRLNAGKLSGYLRIDSSEFYDKIRSLTLLEALPGPIAVGDGLASSSPISLPDRLKQIAQLSPGQFPFTVFPIRNVAQLEDDFTADKLAGFVRNSYVNAWERATDGSLGFPVDLPNMPKFGYLICPQFYLSYVLEQIMALAGYSIESSWLYSAEVQALTITNLTAMTMVETTLSQVLSGHQLVPGLFLPDMSVSDFLKAVKGRFGLVFTFNANSKVCRITQFTAAVAAGAAIDLTPYQAGSAYTTTDPDGTGYTVTEFVDGSDALYKDANGKALTPASEVTGLGQTPVTLKAGTTQLAYEKSPLGTTAYWFVPTVSQPGNVLDSNYKLSSTYLNSDGNRPNSIGLKFLSYRGMSTDSAGNAYPLGTPDVRNGQQTVVGSQSLGLPGQYGSWRAYLRAYYYFRDQTQKITQRLLLPVDVLASLQLDRSVSLSLEDQIRRSYLLSKIPAQAPGIDGKAIVELEVLSLPSGIELAADVVGTPVWVELKQVVLSRHDADAGGIFQIDSSRTTLTLLCWIDASRSAPAAVTSLPVTIRRKSTGNSDMVAKDILDTTYQENVVSYLATGVSTLIETNLLTKYYLYDQVASKVRVDYTLLLSLDPGEGYNILI